MSKRKTTTGHLTKATVGILIGVIVVAIMFVIGMFYDFNILGDKDSEVSYLSEYSDQILDLATQINPDELALAPEAVPVDVVAEQEMREDEELEVVAEQEPVEPAEAADPEAAFTDQVIEEKPVEPVEDPNRQIVEFKEPIDEQQKTQLEENYDITFPAESTEGGVYTVEVEDPAAAAALATDPLVESVETDGVVEILEQVTDWGVTRIGAPQIWSKAKGDGVKVAVLDTGAQADHPDLQANLVAGYDFVNNDANPADGHGHGTHVSGTIAAVNNSIGVVGAAYGADIMPVKVLSDGGWGYWSDVARGIYWATDHGAKVISMSLGGTSGSTAVEQSINYATGKGVLVVSAAANSAKNYCFYPAAYANSMCIMATDRDNKLASFSNYGGDLSAPGVSIRSTYKGSGYAYMSGTSMATPHVSAAAAVLYGACPTCTRDQIKDLLTKNAVDLGDTGFDQYYGAGLLNLAAAVNAIKPDEPKKIVRGKDMQALTITKPNIKKDRFVVPKKDKSVEVKYYLKPIRKDSKIKDIKVYLNDKKIKTGTKQRDSVILETAKLTRAQYTVRVVAEYTDGGKQSKQFVLDLKNFTANKKYSLANPENLEQSVLLAAVTNSRPWPAEVLNAVEEFLYLNLPCMFGGCAGE